MELGIIAIEETLIDANFFFDLELTIRSTMKKLWISFIALLVFYSCTDITAQSNYKIHVGTALPLTKFESIGYSVNGVRYGGYASIGINAGFQYRYQISNKNLGLYTGVDLIYNPVNNEFKNFTLDFYDELGNPVKKFPAYYNIPISTGLSYSFPIGGKTKLLCEAGLTYNFLKSSDFVTEGYYDTIDWAKSLGFKIGTGLSIWDKVNIQIDYLALGVHNVMLSEIVDLDRYGLEYQSDFTMKINLLNITIGLEF